MSYWPTCPVCDKGKFLEKSEEEVYEEDNRLFRAYVVTYDCGHSAMITLLPDSLMYIDNAIKNKRWFEGIIMACAYLERLSLEIISKNMEKGGEKLSKDKINRMSLMDLIIILFTSNMIDQPTYTRMMEIKKERDRLVHYVKPIHQLEAEKSKTFLKKAIKVFESLTAILDEFTKS